MIVEAAETLFVPSVVYNNVKGEDERTLKSFQEPSWNNPVVRVVDSQREMLAPRLNGNYTVGGLAQTMVTALSKRKIPVPEYLRLLAEEARIPASGRERATFAMHCFWQGEVDLGSIPGVLATQPGFLNGEEVVELEYDPSRVSYETLLARAQELKCARTVYTRSDGQHRIAKKKVGGQAVRTDKKMRLDSEPKYYLFKSELRYLPMTPLQASRVNSARAHKGDVTRFLSPRQRALLETIRAHPRAGWKSAVEQDFAILWRDARGRAKSLATDETKESS